MWHECIDIDTLTVMELRSSDLADPDGTDGLGSKVKATPSTSSDAVMSSGLRNRQSGSPTSSAYQRTSPATRQTAAKASSCSNNEHCSPNSPQSQHPSAVVHDSTNGQVMANPGNSTPASSASSTHNRQREVLLYGSFLHDAVNILYH